MLFRLVASLAVAVALAGCTYQTNFDSTDEALNAEADTLFEELVTSQDDALVARMSSESDPEQIRQVLPQLREVVGHTNTPDPELVGGTRINNNDGEYYQVEQRYRYPDRTVTLASEFIRENGEWKLRGFNVRAELGGGEAAPEQASQQQAPQQAPVAPQAPVRDTSPNVM